MAQAYSYQYKGQKNMKQDKPKAFIPLDKSRIWLDFNEFCTVDEKDGAPIYLFSQGDIVNDSDGKDIVLHEGMEVSVFDNDFDETGKPDAILAEGILIKNILKDVLTNYPYVKWLVKLTRNKVNYKSGAEYGYWLSDL